MNEKQKVNVWTLSLVFILLRVCYAIFQTSILGWEGVINFIDPLLMLSVTAALIKFQKLWLVITWMALFIPGYLINLYSKETTLGMIGSFIFLLLICVSSSYLFLKWTKSVWIRNKNIKKGSDL